MNNPKEMSKRQTRRDQIRRKEKRGRLIGIGFISVLAILVAFLIIWPNFKPLDNIVVPEPQSHPQADKTALGNPNAPVKVDVYEDFQCPACRKYTQEIEPLVIENLIKSEKIYYVFHQYPFLDGDGAGNGGESDQAANAAMCAAEQDKFWEMHDVIFANWKGENEGAYSDRRLSAFAETAGIKDLKAFNTCFDKNKYKVEIQADFDGGVKLGVTGTPAVLVNGIQVNPGFIPSYEEILAAVEAAGK